jgi:hypothetical protein
LWSLASPARRLHPTVEGDPVLAEFAYTVIRQRPAAYLGMVAEQTSWHLRMRAPVTDIGHCLTLQWVPPAEPGGVCQPRYYLPANGPKDNPPPAFVVDNPDARVLNAYGRFVVIPGPLYAIAAVLALVAAVWRPRHRPWRPAADALLFTGAGLGLIVGSVATSLFDYRYAVPAVLLVPLGLALSVTRIAAASSTHVESEIPCPPAVPISPATTSKSPSSSPA